jgi:hypothetical protein
MRQQMFGSANVRRESEQIADASMMFLSAIPMCVAGLDERASGKHQLKRAVDNIERWEPRDVIDRFFKR